LKFFYFKLIFFIDIIISKIIFKKTTIKKLSHVQEIAWAFVGRDGSIMYGSLV